MLAAVAGTFYKRYKFSLVKTIRNAHLYFIDLFTIWCSLFWGVVRFGFVLGRVERILRKHVSVDVNNTVCKERIFTTRPTRSQRHRRTRYKMTYCSECQSASLRGLATVPAASLLTLSANRSATLLAISAILLLTKRFHISLATSLDIVR